MLSRGPSVCVLCFFFILTRRCSSMPRRGWSTADVPAGWIQIVRGPRPCPEQWPHASATRWAVPRVPSSVQHQPAPLKPTLTSAKDKGEPRRSPGCSREQDLQVGEGSGCVERFHRTSALKSELEKARQAAKVPLLNQISSTQYFIRHSEEHLAELEKAHRRQLEEARCAHEAVASSPSATPLDLGT